MKRIAGFTLLELLVAIVIFVMMMVPAYGWMSNLLNQADRSARQAERMSDLQLAYRVLERDIEQLTGRTVRNEYGDTVAALVGGSGFSGVEFSRAGYPNPEKIFLRSEIQRVAYVPDEDRLLRRTWRALDRAQDSEPDEQVLMNDLDRFSIRFLDQGKVWHEQWPPLQAQGTAGSTLPKAIEIEVELRETGILNWVFRVPQTPDTSATQGGPGTAGGGDEG